MWITLLSVLPPTLYDLRAGLSCPRTSFFYCGAGSCSFSSWASRSASSSFFALFFIRLSVTGDTPIKDAT